MLKLLKQFKCRYSLQDSYSPGGYIPFLWEDHRSRRTTIFSAKEAESIFFDPCHLGHYMQRYDLTMNDSGNAQQNRREWRHAEALGHYQFERNDLSGIKNQFHNRRLAFKKTCD